MSSGELVVKDERPAFLQQVEGTGAMKGTEGLAQKVRPSFVKLVQKNSNDTLLAQHPAGCIILTPDLLRLAAEDEMVAFTPLLWYTEYCKWSPNALKGIEPMIKERSFDPNSQVAIKSMSQATWAEDHPSYPGQPKYRYRYCEHLNFIVQLMDEEFQYLDPVLISFVKTNFSVGQRLSKLILGKRAPLYAGVYQLGRRMRESAENQWRVFTVDNCEAGSWVTDQEQYAALEKKHDFLHGLHKDRAIDVEYDIIEDEEVPAEGASQY